MEVISTGFIIAIPCVGSLLGRELFATNPRPGEAGSGDVTTVYVGSGEHLRRAQQKVTDYINGWMLPQPRAKARKVAAAPSPSAADTWTPADIRQAGGGGAE